MIIAIDGPAGSGKTTTAQEVARRLGFLHLDSGALYRAFALAACERGWVGPAGDVPRERIVELAALDVDGEVVQGAIMAVLEGRRLAEEIRTPEVTACASIVSAHPEIREQVNAVLRRLAAQNPTGIVCEGRDMGTAVFPEAELKVYMDAQPEERARRRLLQRGEDVSRESVSRESARLVARDRQDSRRAASPLRKAEDATVVDTTRLSFEEQVAQIVEAARRRPGSA
ncbi:MAG: (d)CMP kinase [Gemmatimonadota bacterium]|nr:MAG: (d)CMP kinase [Gemmatimonadota bacterium]